MAQWRRGAALIAVLWIVAVMGSITMVLTRQARLSLKINRNVTETTQAELLAEACIHRAMAALVQDLQETTSDNKNEDWYDSKALFGDVILGKGVYRAAHPNLEQENTIAYGLTDECGKLNLNTATREMLLQLPNAEETIVDAILDWRDEDSDPRQFGAEDEYYQSLPEPYLAKNNLFDTLEELLLVKDMTLNILYGEDTNTNGLLDSNENDGEKSFPLDNGDGSLNKGWYPFVTVYSYEKNISESGEQRINANTASREELQENFGETLTQAEINAIINARNENNFQSVGDLLGNVIPREKLKEIIDRITITADENLSGRINVNTAPKEVLQCLLPENEDVVENIIEYRQASDGPFDTIGELLDVDAMTDNLFRQLAGQVCTKSSVFSIRAVGFMPDTQAYKEIYAILDRGGSVPEIRYWKVIR
jgi:type II secretory pathway component PulK